MLEIEDRFGDHFFGFIKSEPFANESKVAGAGQGRGSENHCRHFLEQLVLQQPRDIYRRAAQEDSPSPALQPIDKALVIALDDKVEIETKLSRPSDDVLSIRRRIFQCVQHRFQTIERVVERLIRSADILPAVRRHPCLLFFVLVRQT